MFQESLKSGVDDLRKAVAGLSDSLRNLPKDSLQSMFTALSVRKLFYAKFLVVHLKRTNFKKFLAKELFTGNKNILENILLEK